MSKFKEKEAFATVVTLKAKQGKEKELKESLSSIIPGVRKLKGCISYNLYVSYDSPQDFMIAELWEKKENYNEYYNGAIASEWRKNEKEVLTTSIIVNRYFSIDAEG